MNFDSDDDDGGIHVDEESEERLEKFGSQTCEEEVERRPDGHEIRMKKTRIVNKSQTSKCVINRLRNTKFAYLGHHKNARKWSR